MCSPDTRPSVLDRLVTDRELAEVEPHHFRFNFHLVVFLARVDSDHASNHLRHHNHVSEMGLDQVGFLVGLGVLFGFAQFFDQAHGFALQAAVEAAAGACVDEVAELLGGEVEESVLGKIRLAGVWMERWDVLAGWIGVSGERMNVLVKVDTTVGEFAEGSLLLKLYVRQSPSALSSLTN